MTRAATATGLSQATLPRGFFERDPIVVARELLGSILVRKRGEKLLAGRIVETEAYVREYQGTPDRAAHSSHGLTARTSVLFGPGGHAYVYLIYGIHECLNVSADRDGVPGCVLIRAVEPIEGVAEMRAARPGERDEARLCAGPGNLTKAFGIGRADNGRDLTVARAILSIRSASRSVPARRVVATGRVGIRYGKEWPLRFYISDSKSVSRAD